MEELETLLARAQDGDLEAYGEIVHRFQDMAVGYARAILGDFHLAEDVAQETFLSLHRHGRSFRNESRFSTFVYRVAANAALNRRRSLGRARMRVQKLIQRHAAGDRNGNEVAGLQRHDM